MQIERRGVSPPRVTAAPVRVNDGGRTEALITASVAVEVSVYPLRGEIGGPRFQVADHEADRMTATVLAGREAVDAFAYVLSAQPGIASRNPLALDDRVRIMVVARFGDGRGRLRHASVPAATPAG